MAITNCSLSKLLRLSSGKKIELVEGNSMPKNGRVRGQFLGGPCSCGKTSLLFEYAFNCAEKGDFVLFVAPKPLIKLPMFVNGRKQPNAMVLKRINIVYLASYVELIAYFANAHVDKTRNSPVGRTRHVLIDDFDWYIREKGTKTEDTIRVAKCLAYIIDAIKFWSKDSITMQSSVDSDCSVLISETISRDSLNVEKIGLYKHWLTDFIKVQQLDGSSFKIQPLQLLKSCDNLAELTFHYEIEDGEIKVKCE